MREVENRKGIGTRAARRYAHARRCRVDDARRHDAADLTDDLLFMRKGPGFTAKRIVNAGTLRHVLGGHDEPFDNLRDRFVSAIRSLRDPEPALLLAAYGLAPDYVGLPMLRQRRERYGRTINRKVDTVADREDAAIEHPRVQLLTGWYTPSPVSARIPEMHNGIIQESVHVSTLVVDRQWQETREHYRFMALFDEADYIAISSSYPGRPLPEGDFAVKTVRTGQSFSHQFWHYSLMKGGQTYDLRFRLVPDDDYGRLEAIIEEARVPRTHPHRHDRGRVPRGDARTDLELRTPDLLRTPRLAEAPSYPQSDHRHRGALTDLRPVRRAIQRNCMELVTSSASAAN